MTMKFKTKLDVNGNTYTLTVNDDTKEFSRGYNPFSKSDFITITKRDRNLLISQLEENGYKEV